MLVPFFALYSSFPMLVVFFSAFYFIFADWSASKSEKVEKMFRSLIPSGAVLQEIGRVWQGEIPKN